MTTDHGPAEPGPLPLPDYDQLSVGELEHRIRSLDRDALHTLLHHERRHADRAAVVLLLENRIDHLERGGTPSPGGAVPMPSTADSPPAESPVSPGRVAEPRHGFPHGTPQQPGKGNRMGPAT